jgi:hypothetical protein
VVNETSTSSSSRGNYDYKSYFAHSVTCTCDTLDLASIPTTRSSDWIVDSGTSHHVSGVAGEFSSYSRLVISESIQTVDGTAQPVVGKGTVKCTNTLTMSNVLHALFPMNLLSISAIISQLKFGEYLSSQGIQHQTTCPYTPEQNRRTNIYLRLLEV